MYDSGLLLLARLGMRWSDRKWKKREKQADKKRKINWEQKMIVAAQVIAEKEIAKQQ